MSGVVWITIGLISIVVGVYAQYRKSPQSGNARLVILIICAVVAAFALPYGFHKISSGKGDLTEESRKEFVKDIDGALNRRIKEAAKDFEPFVQRKYREGYATFAVTRDGMVVPAGIQSEKIDVWWETAKVLRQTSEFVELSMPRIVNRINRVMIKKGIISRLPKRVGASSTPLSFLGGLDVEYRVLRVSGDFVLISLGFVRKSNDT